MVESAPRQLTRDPSPSRGRGNRDGSEAHHRYGRASNPLPEAEEAAGGQDGPGLFPHPEGIEPSVRGVAQRLLPARHGPTYGRETVCNQTGDLFQVALYPLAKEEAQALL